MCELAHVISRRIGALMTKGLFRRYHGQLTSVRNEALDDKGFISVLY